MNNSEKLIITLGDVWKSQSALNILAQKQLPTKAAYRVSRLISKVQIELKFIQEKRLELFKEFGTEIKDPQGQSVWSIEGIIPESKVEFDKKMDELFELPCEMEFHPVALGMLEGQNISAADILALDKFIVE